MPGCRVERRHSRAGNGRSPLAWVQPLSSGRTHRVTGTNGTGGTILRMRFPSRFGALRRPRCRCLLPSLSVAFAWQFGDAEEAAAKSEESIALARELSHPFSLAIALDYAAMLGVFRQEGRHSPGPEPAKLAQSAGSTDLPITWRGQRCWQAGRTPWRATPVPA